jgi:hypothetical protein
MISDILNVEIKTMEEVRHLYEAMIGETDNAKKHKNLEMLWSVLNKMQKNGAYDYSVAKVGAELEKLPGGMRTQSIHNAKGVYFKRLIQAFGTAAGGSLNKIAKDKSQADRAIDLISDPGIRSVLRQSMERLKKLEHENNELRSAFKQLRIWNSDPILDPAQPKRTITENSETLSPAQRQSAVISQRLVEALRKGIDKDRLAERGLVVHDNGSITMGKVVLFPPGFVEAINLVI